MKNFLISKSRRIRSTPYTSRIEKQGLTSYTVYNHMLLPTGFNNSLEDDYYHLKEHVQVWDVAGERQVEISGKDSARLVQLMTCRDLSKSKDGRCYYCPIIDNKGGLINDPVVLRHSIEKWWLSIADSDVILYAKGLAIGYDLKVNIIEPNVNILAVQGPKSYILMEKILGEKIRGLKFFDFDYFEFKDTDHLIARSGWSKQGGYEIYVENTKSGLELYDSLFDIGKEFNIRPGYPNLIERIESALLSCGNDFDNNDNPFECGFDKFINIDSDVEFIGKNELKKIQTKGITRKLMGIIIETKTINVSGSIELKDKDNNIVGDMRSGVYSPNFKKVIGIAMINKPFWNVSQEYQIVIGNDIYQAKLCALPFI
ncbi:MAG: dimethylsulfoniopropionate demethylase [Pelagibacteraceae bacterium]|nr:dimethylsulfoniopropionate demethylase [Pelagibacteraceae bacterium]